MLRDLNVLARASRENYQTTFVNEDFKLTRDFKERLEQVLDAHNTNIQFFTYSAEIVTSSGNKIFCPNQWFYIATFIVEFTSELFKYKDVLGLLADSGVRGMSRREFMNKVRDLKGKIIDNFAPEVREAIYNHFGEDTNSSEYLCRFLTDYDWWHGSKTIDRGDFYNSPVLSLLGLVAVSQGYVADITYYLASDRYLMQRALSLQAQEFRTHEDSPAENLIVYGAPGTGKSKYLEDNYQNISRVVFHSEYTYYDFVGSYKPVPLYKQQTNTTLQKLNGENFNKGEPVIDYQYVAGPFINILIKCLRNPETKQTLLIEELNRANAPAVFGDVFQLLDREAEGMSKYRITPNEDLKNYLMSIADVRDLLMDGLFIPENMNIVATMNSADQGVYVLDSAFKRRWKFKYIPIKERGFVHENTPVIYGNESFEWRHILTSINNKLKSEGVNEDRLIGPYFISPEEIGDANSFSSKLLIYLWDDVVRYKRQEFFDADIKTYSELVTSFTTGTDVMNIKDHLYRVIEGEEEIQEHEVDIEEPLEPSGE